VSRTVHVNAPDTPRALRDRLARAVRAVLRAEGVKDAEVSLTLLPDDAIQRLNREYLGKDRPTDVIAFTLESPLGGLLGDVYLGTDEAARQAAERVIPLEEELLRIAIHGTLHLAGHDHPEGEDREESPMFVRQEELLRSILDAQAGRAP
jgi:probable rRNA maturation factor